MSEKKQKKPVNKSYILTRETLGMTIMLFSAIVLFILFSRSLAFGGMGRSICTFMYGTFGYGSYLVTVLLGYLGFWLVAEKSVKVKPALALSVSACALMFFLLFHAVTTRNIPLDSYGGYLSACYKNAAAGWSGYNFGGVICGIIVYPVAKLTTFIGAYVIFSILFVLCAYLVVFTVIRAGRANKAVSSVKVETVEEDDYYEREAEPVSTTYDHLYSVNSSNEIVDNLATPNYVEPAYEETSEPQTDDDKFSARNLGRKILFENGEFAAESYRRNMIFSKDSYFNHPVTSESDYLSSFSSNPSGYKKTTPTEQSYTQSYQNDVMNQSATETPSSYVYGEKPVQNLDGYDKPDAAYRPAEQYPAYEERVENSFSDSARQTESRTERYVPPVEEILEEPVIEEQVQPEPPKEEKHRGILSKLFGGDSVRGERGREESRTPANEERSNQNLFDDDVDLGEDVFGVSSREVGSDRADRSDRGDRGRSDMGFTPSVSDRRAAEPPKPTEPVRSAMPQRQEPPVEEKPVEKPKHVWKKYVRPPLDLLDDYPENSNVNTGEIEDNKRIIVETLSSFKIGCEISNVTVGPAITRYDVIIEDKLNIKRSLNYKDAIAMALMKDNINAYLNFAKGALSIEVPNNKRTVVGLKTMLASPKFFNSKPNSLTFGLGKNVEGEVVCPDITKMPHLLVAGTTGSGKSICLSTLLISLLYKYGPEELRLILVDPKQVEFISYDKLPHLMINEIIYDVDKAIKALNWANKEMERRYTLFKEMTENGIATKTLDEYNAHLPAGEEKLPKVVIILDEFGDLMLQAKKDIEGRIIKLVQKARACGIHLILATQRPSVDCITGLIKSNLPTRIGFKVNSFADSSTIFDIGGAEKLLGRGDMYFRSTENPELTRIQGCFVDTHEVQKVTDFVKANNETYFDNEVSDFINKVEEPESAAGSIGGGADSGDDGGDAKIDDTFIKALKFCVTSNQASVSMIQRRFPVGYIKACKIIDWMENMNYITQSEGSKPRKVLMTKDEFVNIYGEVDD